jgi:predicted hotdog family 3-hydroxylacyl-ACP dehydratase
VRIERAWIERHIPHQGAMCLLDEVLEWDPSRIRCRSATHRSADNPLRAHGRLGAACGIEYASQAMAVHSALLAAGTSAAPAVGYLGSLRNVALHVARLDDIDTDLIATATRISSNSRVALYEFSVQGAGRILLSGRATVILDAASLRA